jgi:carbon monoxide dehydrogenase subunit G/predicted flap endonuclease-1-like 5' DNA nuclease
MELEHSFTVPVTLDRAWDVLLDVERVAPCMPGASLDSVDGDDITGKIKVKVGPISMTYAGKASFTERNREAGVVMLTASGKETRGAGTASASVRSQLTADGDSTHVTVHTTLNVTGKPAQFGRGVLNEVGGRLIGIFSDNLAKMLAAEPAAAEPAATEPAATESATGPAADAGSGLSAAASASDELAPDPGQDDLAQDDLAQPIEELSLPLRAHNSLRREGVHTVADLVAKTPQELLAIENIGPASVEEIRQRLADRGLSLSEGDAGELASANGAHGPATAFPVPEPARDQARAPLHPVPSGRTEPSWHAEDDAIDLLSVAGFPVLKRALPVAAGVVAIAVVALARRFRKRRARR